MNASRLLPSRKLSQLFTVYFLLSIVSSAMVFLRMYKTGSLAYGYLIWNLFLAWVPFLLSLLLITLFKKKQGVPFRSYTLVLIGVVWLFFYPNAPYMITDYIHIGTVKFYEMSNGQFVGYNQDILVWYDLVMMSLFIFIGVLLGYLSLYLMQSIVGEKWGGFTGYMFVVAILFLSSFGIYLGRFIRWNTWDIIANPFGLMRSVMESLHSQALLFTLVFGVFLNLLYLAFSPLVALNKKE